MSLHPRNVGARSRALRAALVAATLLAGALAVTASATAAPRDFFGVMPQAALVEEDFERMGRARVGTLRFEVPWVAIDPSPAAGDTNWGLTDGTMTRLANEGIEPLPFLFGSPDWAAEADGHNCKPAPREDECVIAAPRTAAGREHWRNFVTEVVERYGPGGEFWAENPSLPANPIRVVQIWNEQNSDSFYGPKPNVKGYAKLLDASREGVDAANPKVDVILGGMFGTPQQGRKPSIAAWKFLDKLYGIRGAKRDFDGIGVHPYAAQLKKVIAQFDLFRDEIEEARDRKAQIWITELGWASSGPNNPLVRGSRGQAKRLTAAFEYFLSQRRNASIEAVIWYSWRDNPDTNVGLCEWCAGSGLVTDTLKAKPSLKAFAKFTRGS